MFISPKVIEFFILIFNYFLIFLATATFIFFIYLILKSLRCLKVIVNKKLDRIKNGINSFGKGESILERKCYIYGIVSGINSRVYPTDTPATFFVDKLNSYNFSNVEDLGLMFLSKSSGKIKAYNEETGLYCVDVEEENIEIRIGGSKLKLDFVYAPYECLLLKEKAKIKERDFEYV